MGSLAWEAVLRLQSPQPLAGLTVMVVAGVGIVINTATALLFMRGSEHDLNLRGAFCTWRLTHWYRLGWWWLAAWPCGKAGPGWTRLPAC